MGKKKSKKRPRAHVPSSKLTPEFQAEMQRASSEQRALLEKAFEATCDQLRAVLAQFHPRDSLAALNVSDLWQPNRASQVKHQLAFSLLVSMPADSFAPSLISTYEDFAGFCGALFESFPDFHMLEDYVPEADWGAVKFLMGDEPIPILHGGPVQRIVDYMEAFRICHAGGSQAMVDLEHAIGLQRELLSQILVNGDDQADGPNPGHVEVPPASFWEAAMPAMGSLSNATAIRADLIVELGQPTNWNGWAGFGDAMMTGTALPWLAARIDGSVHAMSLRNTATVVIDIWAKTPSDDAVRVADRLGGYLAKRIPAHLCLTGPLLLRSGGERVSQPIAAVLFQGPHYFFVVPAPSGQLARAGKAIAAMHRVMRDAADWGLQSIGTTNGFQLRDAQGKVPASVQMILVNTSVSTALQMVELPKGRARHMALVDACTIFDSIESVTELAQFWKYVDGLAAYGGSLFSDLGDQFGSFRDVHAQIIEGALTPNFIGLDPHWGASWRYKQLKHYWENAPRAFPDDDSAWTTHEHKGTSSLRRLTAKNYPKVAWSSMIGKTTVHFILDVDAVGLGPRDGQLLELFVHCAADCLAERASIIEPFLQLPQRRITLSCFSAPDLLATADEEKTQAADALPLITAWDVTPVDDVSAYAARLTVNLSRLAKEVENASDARFEANCAMVIVERLCAVLGSQMPHVLRDALSVTARGRPRFTFKRMQRPIDVPDFTDAQVPRQEDYKVARRDLAVLLKAQGVKPGTYTLDAAKVLIDPARAGYRDALHQRIRELDRESLLRFGVEQYDALTAAYDRDELRIKQSLHHEVEFDREESLAESHEKFVRESRNYRYLLESALVLASPQTKAVKPDTVLSILAVIDWLFVLYGASDVLHNGIDVGGLRIDDQYVPAVFYSEERDAQEEVFGRETAALRLGVNVADEDKVTTALSLKEYVAILDSAFAKDLRFTYTQLMQVLSTLALWVSVGGSKELACGYASERQTIAECAVAAHPGMLEEGALAAIDFLELTPDHVWRLLGKDVTEGDVPVWEHSKRGSRHTIRPLIKLPDGRMLWGAAAAGRAARIWSGTISSGYLPADFPWPAVRKAVGSIKKELENVLEVRAHEICARVLPFAIKGVDFWDRFPREQFPDVGDFDVLAYRPELNQWLTVECKYNQPAFCLKDTRRLRDRIFGGGSEPGQMRKIEGRRAFLTNNVDKLRTLLGWPESANKPFSLTELYVSKDMHFWLRFPPYEVPTHFVQIDTLHAWLQTEASPLRTTNG